MHRDVKPANVLITAENQVKLLDFGLAHLSGRTRITDSDQRLGTAGYMSPEQVRGRTIDRRTDLWGLGVLLYEMLTGRRPFRGRSEMSTLGAIVHEEPISLRDRRPALSTPLAQIVRRCLAKIPDRRYDSAGALRTISRR